MNTAEKVQRLHDRMQLGFDITGTGEIRKSCANARHALRLLVVSGKYDAFHDRLLIAGEILGIANGVWEELNDHHRLTLRRFMEEKFQFDPNDHNAHDALTQMCLENTFDPVVNYINGLVWDGKERLEKWLITYCTAPDTPFNRAVSRLTLVALVRRQRQPGCKFDFITVLEGPEGRWKSEALKTIAGCEENFSDQTVLGQTDEKVQERLRGKLVYEIAELSNMDRAHVDGVKSFASRTHDRARPAYGRTVVDQPRRCVIFGTTNNERYLKSNTGNRRFWPVKIVGKIDIEALKRDRDQLLAEAAEVERLGQPLELPENLWSVAGKEQERRRETDPWEDALPAVLNQHASKEGDEWRIHSGTILNMLGLTTERQKNLDGKRVADAMRLLGWSGPDNMQINGTKNKGYRSPPGWQPGDERMDDANPFSINQFVTRMEHAQ